eukprot:1337135-Alexandrium_andersonii.AAC.1
MLRRGVFEGAGRRPRVCSKGAKAMSGTAATMLPFKRITIAPWQIILEAPFQQRRCPPSSGTRS